MPSIGFYNTDAQEFYVTASETVRIYLDWRLSLIDWPP